MSLLIKYSLNLLLYRKGLISLVDKLGLLSNLCFIILFTFDLKSNKILELVLFKSKLLIILLLVIKYFRSLTFPIKLCIIQGNL